MPAYSFLSWFHRIAAAPAAGIAVNADRILCLGLLAAMPMAISPAALDAAVYPKLSLTCLILLAVLGSLVLGGRAPSTGRESLPRRAAPLGNPIFLFAAAYMVLQAVSVSRSPHLEEGIWTLMLRGIPCLAAVLCFRACRDLPRAARWISRAAVAGTAVQVSIGLPQYLGLAFLDAPGSYYLPNGTLLNKNILAAWLAMALPMTALSFHGEGKAWRFASRIAYPVSVFLLVAAHSRAAWAMLFLSLAAWAAAWAVWRRRGASFQARTARLAVILGGSAALSAMAIDSAWQPSHLRYRAQPGFGGFMDRSLSLADPGDGRNQERREYWSGTWRMIREKPWLGFGSGSWKTEYPRWATPHPAGDDPFRFAASPHNDYLLVASESGLPGALAFLGMLGAAGAALLAAFTGKGRDERGPAALAVALGLSAYAIDALAAFPGDRAENAAFLGLLLGASALAGKPAPGSPTVTGDGAPEGAAGGGASRRGREYGRTAQVACALLVGAGLVLSMVLCMVRWQAEIHLKRGLAAKEAGKWDLAAKELHLAESWAFRLDRTGTPVAYYRAMAELGLDRRETALALLRRAYAVNPNHVHVAHDLGSVEVSLGHFESGIARYAECLALRPGYQEPRIDLAAAYFNDGKWRRAQETLRAIPPASRTPRAEEYYRVVTARIEGNPSHD